MAKFLVMQNYEGGVCPEPIYNWAPADVKAHIEFQIALNDELTGSGELVDAQGLAGPEAAKKVAFDGVGTPVVTQGPFAGPPLAGYRIVDVESEARAIEIAAKLSAAPGQDGVPIQQPIEVRQIMSAPDVEL